VGLVSKRAGAPAGTIRVAIGSHNYIFDDGANAIVDITDGGEYRTLINHIYFQAAGSGGVFVPIPTSQTLVILRDGTETAGMVPVFQPDGSFKLQNVGVSGFPPPANTGVPAITGTADLNHTLTGTNGTWTNATSFTYQWRRSTDNGSTYADIPGATSIAYTPQAADVPNMLKLAVTAHSTSGSTTVETAAVRVNVVLTNLSKLVSAHRGGGAYMAPEEAPEAYNWTLNYADGTATSLDGIFFDCDIDRTSDGTPVLMHDSTVDRTTDGTGATSSFTTSAFLALNIDPENSTPPLGGWAHDHPMTFQGLLDLLAPTGRPLLAEDKIGPLSDVVTLLNNSAMKSRTILAADTTAGLAPINAAGIQSMLVGFPSANDTAATVVAAAPTYFAYSYTSTTYYTDAYLQTLANAGIKNTFYTIRRRSEYATQMARPGVIGGASDDPFYMLGYNVIENSLDLSNGRYHHGMIEASASLQNGKRPTISGGKIVFNQPTTASQWMLLGSLADETQGIPTRITFTVTWNALGTDTARWFGFAFGAPNDRSVYFNSANADNQGVGYVAQMRQNGQLLLSKLNGDGLAATGIATGTAANPVTAVPTSINFQIDYNKSTKAITFTRLDTGASVTVTDATYTGAYMHIGNNSQAAGQQISFSNIVVTR
jgi:hypothetical protein